MTRTCLETFTDMVQWQRPAGCRTERKWIKWYLRPLDLQQDDHGNLYKLIGEDCRVMWCSHVDTVHGCGGKQRLTMRGDFLGTRDGNCLGADDTAGVWLMREMILAKKPGLYVFHRAEECGAEGSGWIAKRNPQFLADTKIAIALDRRGTSDIVTEQAGGKCASDTFAKSLAAQLGGTFKPCPNGIFTDTANYTDIVSECSNLSVGYQHEHTKNEQQNMRFLGDLRAKLIALDPGKLVVERKPGDNGYSYHRWSNFDDAMNRGTRQRACDALYAKQTKQTKYHAAWDHFDENRPRTILGLVKDRPDAIADILEQQGYDAKTLEDEIAATRGYAA